APLLFGCGLDLLFEVLDLHSELGTRLDRGRSDPASDLVATVQALRRRVRRPPSHRRERSDVMEVLGAGSDGPSQVRRCHLWCWAPSARPPEWEQRTLVVGGFSLLGLVAAAVSA